MSGGARGAGSWWRAVTAEHRWVDLALVAVLTVMTVRTTLQGSDGTPAVVAGIVIGTLQTGALLRRRSQAVGVLAVVMLAEMVAAVGRLDVFDYTWPVAVYSVCVYRRPRAAVPVVASLLLLVPVGAALRSGVTGLPYAVHLVDWTGLLLPPLLLAAGFGLAVGADRERAVRCRAAAARAERAEALARHRAVIARDLNAVVAVEVRRTAELIHGLQTGAPLLAERLDEVRAAARDALRTVRLLLERLRAEPPPDGDASASATRVRWLPTRSGVLLALTVTAVLLLAARFPAATRWSDPASTALTVAGRETLVGVLLAAGVLAYAWWRSAPVAALLANTAALVATQRLGIDNHVAATAPVLLYYAVAAGTRPRTSAATTAVAIAVQVAADLAAGVSTGLASIGLIVAVWSIGVLHRRAVRDEERARASRAVDARRAALGDERRHITRELHDHVGHHLSAVALQAGVVRRAVDAGRADEDALAHLASSIDAAVDGLPLITTAGDDSVLRPERLTEAALDRLAAPLRAAGLPIAVTVTEDERSPRTVDEVDLFARRIVQEALTNVLRHGGSAPTTVEVDARHDALAISVVSGPAIAPSAASSRVPGSGLGLQSMRERVDLLDGAFEAGPRPGGGWHVHARLPRRTGSEGDRVDAVGRTHS